MSRIDLSEAKTVPVPTAPAVLVVDATTDPVDLTVDNVVNLRVELVDGDVTATEDTIVIRIVDITVDVGDVRVLEDEEEDGSHQSNSWLTFSEIHGQTCRACPETALPFVRSTQYES